MTLNPIRYSNYLSLALRQQLVPTGIYPYAVADRRSYPLTRPTIMFHDVNSRRRAREDAHHVLHLRNFSISPLSMPQLPPAQTVSRQVVPRIRSHEPGVLKDTTIFGETECLVIVAEPASYVSKPVSRL